MPLSNIQYVNCFSSLSTKWAAHLRRSERLSQLVLTQTAFSLHIHLFVDKSMLHVVTVAASGTLCLSLPASCIIITFACVCIWASTCAELLENLSETSKCSHSLSLMNELFRCLSRPAFQLRGFTKKWGINVIKRRKRKQSGINITNGNRFWLLQELSKSLFIYCIVIHIL